MPCPPMPTPEALAREKIDAMLIAADWVVQDYKQLNLSAARGIALREVPLASGPCDYLLLVDRIPPTAEQTRIVAEVERRLSVIDEMEILVAANLARAARLRQSILKASFAGSSQ